MAGRGTARVSDLDANTPATTCLHSCTLAALAIPTPALEPHSSHVRHPAASLPSAKPAELPTASHSFHLQDQYLELSTWVAPGATLFGAGERAGGGLPLLRNGFPYALWARDLPPTVPYRNSYSSHPFVLGLEEGEAGQGQAGQCRGMVGVCLAEGGLDAWQPARGVCGQRGRHHARYANISAPASPQMAPPGARCCSTPTEWTLWRPPTASAGGLWVAPLTWWAERPLVTIHHIA